MLTAIVAIFVPANSLALFTISAIPSATPAWGNSVMPKYFTILSSHLESLALKFAPLYLPIERLMRYTTPINTIQPFVKRIFVDVKLLADTIGVYLRLQSEEARNAFIGRYYFLDPIKEVAAYCGMSESKCKTLLHRTRVGLKEYLRKEGFDV